VVKLLVLVVCLELGGRGSGTMSYKKAIWRSLSPIMGKVIAIPAISKIIAVSALICSRSYGTNEVGDIYW